MGARDGNKNALKPPEDIKSERVEIRLTKYELMKIRYNAKELNVGVSEYIRFKAVFI